MQVHFIEEFYDISYVNLLMECFGLLHAASYWGLSQWVRLLIDEMEDMDSRNGNGRTPFSYAAEIGHIEVVQLLINWDGVDVGSEDDGGRTSLSWAVVEEYEIAVQLLVNRGSGFEG